jgi:hypothetical protein
MNRHLQSVTRRRIAAAGVLVIIVAVVVALFQVAGDLRESRRASGMLLHQNGRQLEQLDALAKTNEELRSLIKRQATVLEGLVDDNVDPALRETAAELAALSSKILDTRATSSSTTTRTTTTTSPPGAQRPIVVQTTPGPAGPRGEQGPPGAAAPRPTASPTPPCPLEVLRVCVTRP